jgi:hypothetical protein
LSAQYAELLTELVKMRMRLDEIAPASIEHHENCECRLCCLGRMVIVGRKSFPV